MNTIKFERAGANVRMIAHRGVSALETENTCAAFVAAGSRSYYGVETDVHVSADGQFIIFHDDNTLRVGKEDHVIEQTPAQILRAMVLTDLDGGGKTRSDLKIPVLGEYIRICCKYEKECVLELKNPMTPDAIAGIVPVSYTHLDVYKRQPYSVSLSSGAVHTESTSGRPTHSVFPYYRLGSDAGGLILILSWQGCWYTDFSQEGDKVLFSGGQARCV